MAKWKEKESKFGPMVPDMRASGKMIISMEMGPCYKKVLNKFSKQKLNPN